MFKYIIKLKKEKKGATALLTVLIVGAAALVMAVSASYLGLGELDLGFTSQKGAETFAIADGCMEEAYRHLRIDTNYTGDTLSLGAGSCIISITTSGSDRNITVTATLGEYTKILVSNITLSGNNITVNSWY